MRLKLAIMCGMVCVSTAGTLQAQTSDFGIDVPVTVSAGAMYSERLQLRDPSASAGAAGFRGMLYPTLQLGQHWFAYSAFQVYYDPYFYYDAFSPDHAVETNVIQAFAGYAFTAKKASIVIKAGRLASAFGSFPLRYDDATNALSDQPLSYITTLTIRPDQLPCGTADLLRQRYGSVANSCGGVAGRKSGMTPVTLYGLNGIEADVSIGRMDARLQLTSGSPANPKPTVATGDYSQWTAGAGYTIRQGFRVGVSGFRGPYLDQAVTTLLPPGTSPRDFPASAIGTDIQWAHGRWSASGELQRFQFNSPNFTVAPSLTSGYGELKSVITPRLYAAVRAGWLRAGHAVDSGGVATNAFAPLEQSYEIAGGFWLHRGHLLKASYEWLRPSGSPGTRLNVLGAQYIVTFHGLNWAFRP
jgi:hypothetical protein